MAKENNDNDSNTVGKEIQHIATEKSNNNDLMRDDDFGVVGGGEGYTPLLDPDIMNGGGGMIFFAPPPSFSSDDDEDDGDVNGLEETTATVSAETKLDTSANINNDSTDNNNIDPSANSNNNNDFDYLSIADKALMALEEDYNSTLLRSIDLSPPPTAVSIASTNTGNPTTDTTVYSAAEQQQQQQAQQQQQQQQQTQQVTEKEKEVDETAPSFSFIPNWEEAPVMPNKNIDTHAVRRAVQAIHLGNPTLQNKLQQWELEKKKNKGKQTNDSPLSSEKQRSIILPPRQHSIIPSPTLKLFRKILPKSLQNNNNSKKSDTNSSSVIANTSTLSRSATMAHALERLFISSNSSNGAAAASHEREAKKIVLQIHVVGVDHVECQSKKQIETYFLPLVKWIQHLQEKDENPNNVLQQVQEIQFLLIGPNIPACAPPEKVNLIDNTTIRSTSSNNDNEEASIPQLKQEEDKTTIPLQHAYAQCYTEMYHDWLGAKKSTTATTNNNDNDKIFRLAFCFNAGIWGYNDWLPTIQYLIQAKVQKYPVIITSYTIEEAQDDYETIREQISSCQKKKEQPNSNSLDDDDDELILWSPECNPFASKQKLQRNTAVTGRDYYENAAWQAWKF